MNTADRSIALMDTALRRRFQFVEMMPDTEVLKDIIVEQDGETIDIAEMLKIINLRIEYLYDREHTIGHAYFMPLLNNPTIDNLAEIFDKNIIPLLKEYFYEDYGKIQMILGDNKKSSDDLKFVKETKLISKDIFNGDTSELDLPEQVYSIQKEALYNIRSYKEISKDL
jgi:5-methylcytosine-specific restriction endonuclease McrBC GTP-binding regulatory subunit McrB